MLSKSMLLHSLSRGHARLCLNSCRQNCYGYMNGFSNSTQSDNGVCFATGPLNSDGLSTINESPELPDWVKVPDESSGSNNPKDDDDFVPPSVSYWIENQKIYDRDADVKHIINEIGESDVDKLSKILKNQFISPEVVMNALAGCNVDISDGLVEKVLRRFSCEWIPSFGFFKWVQLQKGFTLSPALYNLMVNNLGKTRKFDIMWELLEEMKLLEGFVTLDTMTIVMRRLAKAGKYDEAIGAFRKIELFKVDKDIVTMNKLMDALVKHGSVEHAEQVVLEFQEYFPPTPQTYNILVHGWCKTRQIDKARKTIDEMKNHGFCPSTVTYTSLIEAYSRDKDFRKVDATLEEMEKNDCRPNVVTYTIIMHALAKAKETDKALDVYERMKKNNCLPDASFYTVFINALSRSGRLKDSDTVFEDMSKQGVIPDASTYNALISIAAQNLQEEKALSLLLKMEETRCKPDLNTYAPLLKMCCKLRRMKVFWFLLSHMFDNDVSLDLGTYSLLIRGLCNNGNPDRACAFFEELVLKGFVPMDCTYEILVKGLEKKNLHKEKQRIEEVMARAKQRGSMLQVHAAAV